MCHARTTKGSQLNLDEVDEILSSFFKPAPATTGRERLLAEEKDGNPATQAAGDPRNHTDTGDRHRRAMPVPRGGSNAGGGAWGGRGAAAEVPAEREDRQTAAAAEAEAAPARDSSPPGGPPHCPPRGNARARKKIRFTGELGAFLDGEGMWSDVAVMEAERKAEGNILPQQQQQQQHQDGGRIQHPEQPEDGHGSRGKEEDREQEETQEKQEESKQEEEEEAGVVGVKGGRGEVRSEGEGRDNDGWQAAAAAAAAGNVESPSCPVIAADPRGSPVSPDPTSTSTSAGGEPPASQPAPKSTAAREAAAAVVGGGGAAGFEKK